MRGQPAAGIAAAPIAGHGRKPAKPAHGHFIDARSSAEALAAIPAELDLLRERGVEVIPLFDGRQQ